MTISQIIWVCLLCFVSGFGLAGWVYHIVYGKKINSLARKATNYKAAADAKIFDYSQQLIELKKKVQRFEQEVSKRKPT